MKTATTLTRCFTLITDLILLGTAAYTYLAQGRAELAFFILAIVATTALISIRMDVARHTEND